MANSVRAFSHWPLPDLQFHRSRISKTFYNRSNFSKSCVTVISGRPLTLRCADIRVTSGEICGSRRNESSRIDTVTSVTGFFLSSVLGRTPRVPCPCCFATCFRSRMRHKYTVTCRQLCPVHTRPRQDVNRKKFAHIDVYDTCDLWRAGVDGIANLISQRLAIF